MKIVVVDIDGTISKVGDRINCLKSNPPDWDSFYNRCDEDEPMQHVIDIVNSLSSIYRIVYCTGRRESCRENTVKWFNLNGVYGGIILMRPDGDHRHDTELKPELIEKAGIKLEDVEFVLEDRNSMVKKWREMGLVCLQVADGDF
jgi:phosphoglycolate phosphatase-like HAD superfamily hydrolase